MINSVHYLKCVTAYSELKFLNKMPRKCKTNGVHFGCAPIALLTPPINGAPTVLPKSCAGLGVLQKCANPLACAKTCVGLPMPPCNKPYCEIFPAMALKLICHRYNFFLNGQMTLICDTSGIFRHGKRTRRFQKAGIASLSPGIGSPLVWL